MKEDKTYIECVCGSFDCLMRMWYYNDPDYECFYLDHRVNRWLTSSDPYSYEVKGRFKKLKIMLYNFRLYIKTLKDAIFGKPIYQSANIMLDRKEAKKLAEFILDNTEEN
jgi:hypothetical protein